MKNKKKQKTNLGIIYKSLSNIIKLQLQHTYNKKPRKKKENNNVKCDGHQKPHPSIR